MIYAVTNRQLVDGGRDAFLMQIEKIASALPDGIILREKDMEPDAYEILAEECDKICRRFGVPLIINHFWEAGRKLHIERVHLSMPVFKALEEQAGGLENWTSLGVSVHSREEAAYAQSKGADYLVAGHIFPTECKKGLEARGLDFLADICGAVDIPVFAIGGLDEVRGQAAIGAGAAGICLMSGLMQHPRPEVLIKRFSGRSM